MAVDDQSEISFSIPQGTLPWQPILLVYYPHLNYTEYVFL